MDKFANFRESFEPEMLQLGMVKKADLRKLWDDLDSNGNGLVSLAEVDKFVEGKVGCGKWPVWLNNKPALMRAFKKTIKEDGDGDEWVEKNEFQALLLNIFWFNKLWAVFISIDSGGDRRVDADEFLTGLNRLGLDLSPSEAMVEFAKADVDGGGQILFPEFCTYIRKRMHPSTEALS
eukprot:NODE_20942_length_775_cov_10.652778.p2 GENE.NODE_20942_length_775_cov_10.652778~~NODE_20942_length_775_cov_10.652778.p2  ORF type:complete len:178 (-),score=40.11 NODE_20942_length_775_cov_10.652778:135-668(-)